MALFEKIVHVVKIAHILNLSFPRHSENMNGNKAILEFRKRFPFSHLVSKTQSGLENSKENRAIYLEKSRFFIF